MVVADMSGNLENTSPAKSQKAESPQLSVDTNVEIESSSSSERAVMVEIRGGRTKGALPTSMTLPFAPETTVLDIKTKLAEASSAEKKLSSSGIKLVFEGRALDDTDTLLGMVGDNSVPQEVTVFALLGTTDNGTRTPQSPQKSAPVRSRSTPASPNVGPSSRPAAHFGARGSSEPSSPGKNAPGPGAVAGWEEELRKRVELNMRKAFWDSLEASISGESGAADYAWIVKLYAETRDRLCALTPRREDIRQQVHAALDVELFERMVTHNAFEASDLYGMVEFTFDRLGGLCSPARDAEVEGHREALKAMIGREGTTFAAFAVAYLKAFHATVDNIEADISNFRQQMQQQQQQQQQQPASMPPPAAASPAASASPAAAAPGSTRELKASLRQLGLSEEVLGQCVERGELEALLQKALGRAAGTVAGGVAHPSMVRSGAPSVSRSLDLAAEGDKVELSFSVLSKGASPVVKRLALRRSGSIADARAALAALLSTETEVLPPQLQLVFAGRILNDEDKIEAVYRPDSPGATVHVVVRSEARP